MNNAITDPAINPTMNDLETGRFHAWEKREASRSGGVCGLSDRMLASIALNAKLWLVAVAK